MKTAKFATTVIDIDDNEKNVILIEKSGDYRINLKKSGANVQIIGMFIGKNNNRYKVNTTQHHKAPDTKSDLLIKSVLFDQSSLDFSGLIKIDKIAQNADAYQRNETLVMGNNVKINTKPTLEILANNVRCTHGATIGKIDKSQLFYLRSRGLSQLSSEKIIIRGFLEGVLSKIDDSNLKTKIHDKITRQLS